MNKRQKLFADRYLVNGFNASEAYKFVYPKAKDTSARTLGAKLLTKVDIKEYIEGQISELIMGKDEILLLLSKRARNESDKEQLKALELIGKTLALFTDKVEGNLSHNVKWSDFIQSDNPNP